MGTKTKKMSRKAQAKAGTTRSKKVVKTSGINPFDVRSNAKTKYEVIGRRVKGQGRNVAIARADAELKRKKTLTTQFKTRNKVNAFKDRRLGEADPSLSMEDKMILRFQMERKRKMRNAQAFALQDSDDEEELFLTHGGQKLDDYDALNQDQERLEDEEDEESRQMDREIINRLHFGGGNEEKDENGQEKKKSHKEIMQEVMMKAKLFKAERQKNKSTQEDVTDQLDAEFNDLKNLLSFRPSKGSKEGIELAKQERAAAPMDEFDKMTRELTFEAKALATERRMTPEEIAKRERDRLEELERKRVARMNGEDSDDEEKDKKGKKKKKPLEIIMPTDDDLGMEYQVDQQFGAEEEEEEEVEEEECEDEEDEEEEDDESDEDGNDDSEEEGDEEIKPTEEDAKSDDDNAVEDEDDSDQADAEKRADRKRKREQAAAELPFIFPCPETPEELTDLFKQHTLRSGNERLQRRAQIIERIVTFYSPRLSAENQRKMRIFFAILVRQFLQSAKQYGIYKLECDAIAQQMYILAQDLSEVAGIVVRELLTTLHKRLTSPKTASKWPSHAELLLIKVLIQIFPTSDLRHNVVSPMETLLAECLMTGSFDTPTQVTGALFTSTLMLTITASKDRFSPEIIVCLKKIVRLYLSEGTNHWLRQDLMAWRKEQGKDTAALPTVELVSSSTASSASILGSLLSIIDLASTQYQFLSSFDELFHPIYLLLHEITRVFFAGQHVQVNTVIAHLHELLERGWNARQPLRLQTFGPSVLPSFTPKFDANYTVRKDKTMDREKAKTKQLERQVKRARKSAARELRRDAAFLAREQQQEEISRVTEKREKQKEIWKWLEEQNATFNEQAKKGGNMLKGGGSGPARKARTSKKQ